jgi:peptidyl-prolyl cis-trans isomerase A (cyclophilin A)
VKPLAQEWASMKWLIAMAAAWAGLLAGCGQPERGVPGTRQVAPKGPGDATTQQPAPDEFSVRFETSAGDFTVQVSRDLAPHGADRFYALVRQGFFDGQRFFRVIPGFVVQWGLSGDPALNRAWQAATIPDDPVKGSNTPGTITFAKTDAPNSRTTQLFINLGDNSRHLDDRGFAPFGRVVEGLQVVQAITAEYGEKPQQPLIGQQGDAYLKAAFPNLDYVKHAGVVE